VTQQNKKKYPWRITQVFLLILGNDKASTFQSIEDQSKVFFSFWAMTKHAHIKFKMILSGKLGHKITTSSLKLY